MFNEEQQKAIETIKGQLILVACPGSGKTTTLLGRIHEMIQQGVPAENILMVTFTTAAAGEMKQRFWKKVCRGWNGYFLHDPLFLPGYAEEIRTF